MLTLLERFTHRRQPAPSLEESVVPKVELPKFLDPETSLDSTPKHIIWHSVLTPPNPSCLSPNHPDFPRFATPQDIESLPTDERSAVLTMLKNLGINDQSLVHFRSQINEADESISISPPLLVMRGHLVTEIIPPQILRRYEMEKNDGQGTYLAYGPATLLPQVEAIEVNFPPKRPVSLGK